MKRCILSALVALPLLLAGTLALADPEPQTQDGVGYVSGGVGKDERATLGTMRKDYNLAVLFARKSDRSFLSDIKVKVSDQSGKVVLEQTSNGPWLYVNLNAGKYKLSAEDDGEMVTRKVSVNEKHTTRLVVYFKKSK